jgi:hypothetical protein
MTECTVGFRLENRSKVLTIEAEDALVAALKVKHNHPEALISYVRKSNRRGDRRNPHRKNEPWVRHKKKGPGEIPGLRRFEWA